MKPIRKFFATLAVVLFFAFIVIEYLNFTGYCYAQSRYLQDIELIEIAANYNIRFSNEDQSAIHYSTAQDLIDNNYNCCTVLKTDSGPFGPLMSGNWVRIFGLQTIVVEVWYRLKSTPPKNYLDSFVAMDACGKVAERQGFYESSPRAERRSRSSNMPTVSLSNPTALEKIAILCVSGGLGITHLMFIGEA